MEERYFTAKEILSAKFEGVQHGGIIPFYPYIDGLGDRDNCLLAFCNKGSVWVIEEGGVAYTFATEDQINNIPDCFKEYKEQVMDPILEAMNDYKYLFVTSDIPRDFTGSSYKSLWNMMSDEFSGGLYTFFDTLRFVKEMKAKEDKNVPQILIFPEIYTNQARNRTLSLTENEQRLSVQKFIRGLDEEDRFVIYSNSSTVFTELRCEVKKGEIEDSEDIGFLFFHWGDGLELVSPKIDRDGRFDFWPDGFFDAYGKQLDVLL